MVYFGEYRSKLDQQGRVVIPVKLRDQLGNNKKCSAFITRGLENCLFLFSEQLWESQSEKMKHLPFTKGDPRAFTRLFFSGAFKTKVDKQGRVLLPLNLIKYADIKERVVIIGVGTRIEIWDEDNWNEYYRKSMSLYGEISEKLMDM
jgi:MraZ protein